MPGSAPIENTRRPAIAATLTGLVFGVLLVLPETALCQEEEGGATFDYGGVQIPLPADTGEGPRQLTPGPSVQRPRGDSLTSVSGRESGRVTVDEDGNEVDVYQSTRVSGVSHSRPGDRFNWFYDAVEIYRGIIPHLRDSLPHIERYQRAGTDVSQPNRVTWIGFQPFETYTRVFLQLARTPSYRVEETATEDGQLIEVFLDNTRLPLSNFQRFIDASYFERSVDIIDAEPLEGGRVRVVIFRHQTEAPYEVEVEGNYLYIDFQDVGRY